MWRLSSGSIGIGDLLVSPAILSSIIGLCITVPPCRENPWKSTDLNGITNRVLPGRSMLLVVKSYDASSGAPLGLSEVVALFPLTIRS